jgi:hypothetical protein
MSVELDESGGAGATGIYKFAEQDGDDPKKVLGYVPSKDDWALLKRRYNALYERRPPWEIIVQDLLLAGHAPSEACKYLVQSPYTVRWLLDEVRKLDAAQPAQDVKAAAAEPPADDGRPFYKPAHFQQWKIGDDLLRKNRSDEGKYTEGKVRRERKKPASGKGKRPVYWYSEPDARKRWPDKFLLVDNTPAKS